MCKQYVHTTFSQKVSENTFLVAFPTISAHENFPEVQSTLCFV